MSKSVFYIAFTLVIIACALSAVMPRYTMVAPDSITVTHIDSVEVADSARALSGYVFGHAYGYDTIVAPVAYDTISITGVTDSSTIFLYSNASNPVIIYDILTDKIVVGIDYVDSTDFRTKGYSYIIKP